MIDPIVKEIRKIREEYAAKFNYDVDAMFADLRQKQLQSNRKIVSFAKDKQGKQDADENRFA